MSVRSRLRSQAVKVLLGDRARSVQRFAAEARRRLTGSEHEIIVFLQLDDPYSYLLSLYLPSVADEYDVALRFHLAQSLGGEFQPEPGLLAEHALQDCRLLAQELGVAFLDKGDAPVVEHRRALLQVLAAAADSDDFPALLCAVLSGYWRGDVEGIARMLGAQGSDGNQGAELIEANQDKLRNLGHYDAGTMFYGGEWYRGLDRLQHLLDRLDGLGARRQSTPGPELAAIRQVTRFALPATVPARAEELPPLDFFFSFRSPYSYVAMQRTLAIADAWKLTLRLRPVLPMVMRGQPVPRAKLVYIGKDAKREAERHGIEFGTWCDPLGAGVERCLAVLAYAETEHKAREFMLVAAEHIWARGTDVATDSGMRQVTDALGLFWPDVAVAMREDSWRPQVEANQEALAEAGAWGVPTFVFGTLCLWGQDRLWLLARQIEDRCQDGEGIMV